MQIAGVKCGTCGKNIVLSAEGRRCPTCQKAFHLACLTTTARCPQCDGAFPQDSAPPQAESWNTLSNSDHARAAGNPVWLESELRTAKHGLIIYAILLVSSCCLAFFVREDGELLFSRRPIYILVGLLFVTSKLVKQARDYTALKNQWSQGQRGP